MIDLNKYRVNVSVFESASVCFNRTTNQNIRSRALEYLRLSMAELIARTKHEERDAMLHGQKEYILSGMYFTMDEFKEFLSEYREHIENKGGKLCHRQTKKEISI